MRLRPENLDTAEQLAEFDQWLTAKLERIKDSKRFNSEIEALCQCIETISSHLNDFSSYQDCSVENICDAVISAGGQFVVGESFAKDEEHVAVFYEAFFNLLFLTSGATDNNLKNHFLIQLKEDDVKPLIPKKGSSKKTMKFTLKELPSTIKSDFIAKSLAACFIGSHEIYSSEVKTEPTFDLMLYLRLLLKEYIGLILENEEEIKQFWAICRSYTELNSLTTSEDLGKYLLNACTIFKVRGSVSATGGHITEDLLREKLLTMGLQPNSDFNTNDVTIGEEEIVEDGKRKKKTRAYDFILPYKIDNWEPKPKLFIQSQFYAGDSGSVSHKVVDQTHSSRTFTLANYANARFVEYLDGAGYYASLRGDLKHMLAFDSTASFFQVKSILVRLRRELQHIKFLTPIELEHAIITNEQGLKESVFHSLELDGYPKEEIERITLVCIELGYISESIDKNGTKLIISMERSEITRRLLILDIAANYASTISNEQRKSMKYLLVPGYGANYGIMESELTNLVCSMCKQITISAPVFASDIEWLLDEGVFKRR
ncbi:hypothetical protein [Psychrobacter maritimus]|uniref:hypothetical protein n=1 Tax=Psychrobacter maritimus TaxID=256325 RepID=UPI00191A31E4|nr:hypothetical protein [Psychrobacter maritimus]